MRRRSQLRLDLLLLPSLIVYGLLVDPITGHGGIPCLWRALFGVRCFGCGLSHADAFLCRGDLVDAVRANWLIIPVWLVAVLEFVKHSSTIIRKGGQHVWLNLVLQNSHS